MVVSLVTNNMPCQWLIKSTREYCPRPTKNNYCGQHAFTINQRGSKAPTPCKECGRGTNSNTQLCKYCGQNKTLSKL
jgi:hypothetical protein